MWAIAVTAGAVMLMVASAAFPGQEVSGVRPLLAPDLSELRATLPAGTRLLTETVAIEQFLDALDGTPPDWATVYGHGHHDPGHDERLFDLNRVRDRLREGKAALHWTVTFLWPGELSGYDPKSGGFSVAVGPKFTPTRWGVVRFKPEELPSNLMAIPNPSQREKLRRRFEKGQRIEVHVAMMGKLIPEESIVYDFSHEEEGRGLVMPVVRIERIDYFLAK
jgi:hypothetical protein